ncbi:MAG: hypothetical protein KAI47_16315, partial [Deltaproteobacteria bacterium]|nr:hypothetical protein [Deltaproteobacteria bacterium]
PLFVDAAWKGQHYTVAPLFYHRHDAATHKSVWHESVWVAGPYWRYHRGREFGDHLLPIAFYRRSFDTRGKRKTIRAGLLPLFYYRRTPKRTTLITPLGGYRRDVTRGMKQGLIGPVLWHESKKSKAFAVMPLFLRYTDKKAKATTSLLFPLLVHHTSPSIQALVIFPFYWRVNYSGDVHHPEEKNLVIFPLFWQTRQKKNGYGADVFFPFYWHLFDKKGSTWVLGPVFSHHRGARRNWGALPLAFYHKTKRKSWLFALPFFWYSHDFEKKQRTYVAGPAYYRRYEKKNKAEKKDKAGAGYLAGVAPLFFHKRTPEQHYTIFFPLVWHFAKPKKKTSLWIAGPYFSHASATKRGVGVFPLFYTSVKKTGERAVGVFPLFYWAKSPTRNALYTPLFGYDKTPERRHLYAGPYFQTRGSKVDRDIVFPLIYRSRNHETKTTTLFALPIYYGSWGPGKSVHVAFPLFWRWRGIDTTSTIVFPLYWDFNDHYASRTTVLFPLLARHRDSHAHSVSWYTLPGVWVRSRPEATDAVVFPLVWHFGGTKRSSTVVFPLYWRFDRPDARTYVVANTYYRRDKRNDTYDFWFLPLFRVQRPRPGDFNFEFLFGLVGYQRVGRNRILRLLYFPIELDPAPGQPSSGVAPLPARKTPVVQGARPQSPQQAT